MIKAIIIDDEKWSRKIIRKFGSWEELGVEITAEAKNGKEALALIEELSPKIIITDMKMPEADGLKLLKKLKEKNIRAKIIIISGHEDFEYLQQAIKSHVFDYILKPIDPDKLNKVLKGCVDEFLLENDHISYLYENFDQDKLDQLIEKIHLLKFFLEEKTLEKIEKAFSEIINIFSETDQEEEKIVKLIDYHLNVLLREEIVLQTANKVVRDKYKEYQEIMTVDLNLYNYKNLTLDLIETGLKLNENKELATIPQMAQNYIEINFQKNISLNKIASDLYTSKEYLSSAFKEEYQINISKYILKLKMEKAAELMQQNLNNSEVAERLSYANTSYYYRVFKKYYGCTPGEYKQKIKG